MYLFYIVSFLVWLLQNFSYLLSDGCISHYLKSGITQTLMDDCEYLLIFSSHLSHNLSFGWSQRYSFYKLLKVFFNRFSHIMGIYLSFHTNTSNLIIVICQLKILKWEVYISHVKQLKKKLWYHFWEYVQQKQRYKTKEQEENQRGRQSY